MWYHVFLWALFSSFLVHTVAGAIAFCRLRSHKIGRFIPVAILAMGIIWPLTAGAITSMCLLVFCFMHFSFVWCVSCPGSVQRFHFVLVISSFGLAWFSSPSSKPLCICYIQGAAKKNVPYCNYSELDRYFARKFCTIILKGWLHYYCTFYKICKSI